ncbi:tagatose 1,6-diphosphate aldolase [Lecanosticta acicola]|uniref:Fructose-bisphosphate aldolase n=1 Tax=Lecanosticta acicola TaxID=111012 RepID=A0AAI8Z6B9_9PEZI|nr:tagatose 1,6-diphosphate aldolase [Lecanosticta acicola]
MKELKQNRAWKMVEAATVGGYAIPAICLYNLEGVIASVKAAEAKSSPVILQFFPWAVEYADGLLVHAAAEAARNAKVPVAVHMDHCQDPEMVKRAADLGGFDGIMVDMSHFEKEENLQKTKELTDYCHARGIITEAEPGRINGGEDGVADTTDLEEVLTTPDQAEEFLAAGIDWLAPAFGNVHGNYGPKGPQLDYPRLESIRESTKGRVHLVLHGAGAAWFDEKRFAECMKCGIAKCNVNDGVNGPYIEVLQRRAGRTGLTSLVEEATAAMQKAVEQHMDWMLSSGRADSIQLN